MGGAEPWLFLLGPGFRQRHQDDRHSPGFRGTTSQARGSASALRLASPALPSSSPLSREKGERGGRRPRHLGTGPTPYFFIRGISLPVGWAASEVLFTTNSPFPTASLRTVLATFIAHGSPVCRASSCWHLRISRTFTTTIPVYLSPFAVYQAFPDSDYYGDSVAMRLAPFRQSRIPSTVDVQDGLGAHFVSFKGL